MDSWTVDSIWRHVSSQKTGFCSPGEFSGGVCVPFGCEGSLAVTNKLLLSGSVVRGHLLVINLSVGVSIR